MKSVLITGASRGIGRYLYEQLSTEYEVIGLARTVPAGIQEPFIQADVSDSSELQEGIRKLNVKRLYGLINCAGIASMNLFLTTPLETVRRVMEVNTVGTMNACRLLLPAIVRNRSGRIINFSSIAVNIGLEGEAVYAASKAAVETFSRILAKEVATYGITVNVVSPNPVDTELLNGVAEEQIQALVRNHQAIQRKGELADILNVVRFYLDERSSMVTGQALVLGGY